MGSGAREASGNMASTRAVFKISSSAAHWRDIKSSTSCGVALPARLLSFKALALVALRSRSAPSLWASHGAVGGSAADRFGDTSPSTGPADCEKALSRFAKSSIMSPRAPSRLARKTAMLTRCLTASDFFVHDACKQLSVSACESSATTLSGSGSSCKTNASPVGLPSDGTALSCDTCCELAPSACKTTSVQEVTTSTAMSRNAC
mmetsp:Transcript_25445/g.70936  ORF Transcript_25445/g.70936 Transcript_25445/m.70936 type:complete len:205 (-) Transcript_25445:1476-2090(-)